MPATAARAQFVKQETRLSTVITNTAIETAYGDLARTTDDGAFDTHFSALADVQHAAVETAALLSVDTRLVTQSANLTPDLLALDFDTVTPSIRSIDSQIALDRTGLVSSIATTLNKDTIEMETWG